MPKFDYSDWSKEDLIKKLRSLKKRKKYGLVWDSVREPEKVILDCQKELPVLKEIKDKEINSDNNGIPHILIEGDNYHALSVLNYTHEKSIDLIYIDPPYNTGNEDFIFNDRYVDVEDPYRHTKWLSFIDSRLRLARPLLKKSGVIFISIDDNELAHLKLLCDEIFGESNFVATLPTIMNLKGNQDQFSFAATTLPPDDAPQPPPSWKETRLRPLDKYKRLRLYSYWWRYDSAVTPKTKLDFIN